MPKVSHSPLKTSNLDKAKSSPVTPVPMNETGFNNPTSRAKRPRPTASPKSPIHGNDLNLFKEEIKHMLTELLTEWKTEQDLKHEKLVSDIAVVTQQNLQIQQTNKEIERSLECMSQRYDDLKREFEVLQNQRQDFTNHILILERKIEDLQDRSRMSGIEIRNIPYQDGETTSDLSSIVINTCKQLKLEILSSDLRDIYRLPTKQNTKKTIVAELHSVSLKNKIIQASRNLNRGRSATDKLNTEDIGLQGNRLPVYIAEYLTPSTRKLFYESRVFAKQNHFKYCWTKSGRIYVRKDENSKAFLIKTNQCLSNLKVQQ